LDHRQKLSQGECSAFPSKELFDENYSFPWAWAHISAVGKLDGLPTVVYK